MQEETHKNANFFERLVESMKIKGYTQESLAAKLGISHSAISRWLTGSKPRPARMVQLAEALGVNVRWLEFFDGPQFPNEHRDTISDEEKTRSEEMEWVMETAIRPIYRAPDEAAIWPHADKLYAAARISTGDLSITLAIMALQEIRKRRKEEGAKHASAILADLRSEDQERERIRREPEDQKETTTPGKNGT